jgi:hypothetical protein
MLKYWPLLLITGILAIIVGMSQYADSSRRRYEERAKLTKAVAVAKDDDGQAGNNADGSYKPPIWAKFVTFPEGVGAWAVILTLLAIAWQSIETRTAARATRAAVLTADKSLAHQEKFARRQLRAYVEVKGARLFIRDDGSVQPRVTLINCGQTPAHDLRGVQYGRFDSRPFKKVPRPPPEDMPPASTGTAPAGEPYYFTGKRVESGRVKEILLADLESPTYAFVLNGWYSYEDIFEDSHHTEFQVIIGAGTPLQIDSDSTGEWLCFFNDVEGNEST